MLSCSYPDPERPTDCLDNGYKHYELGDGVVQRRMLEFTSKLPIVLDGEHQIYREWNWKKTFEHLIETCENVGFMTYRHPTVPNAIRCETSFGPAFDLFFSEDRETLTHITKSTRQQKDLKWIDFRDPVTDWR